MRKSISIVFQKSSRGRRLYPPQPKLNRPLPNPWWTPLPVWTLQYTTELCRWESIKYHHLILLWFFCIMQKYAVAVVGLHIYMSPNDYAVFSLCFLLSFCFLCVLFIAQHQCSLYAHIDSKYMVYINYSVLMVILMW